MRYATRASRCVAVAWTSGSEGQPAACPTPGARTATRAGSADGARLAWQSLESPVPAPGTAASDASRALLGVGLEANPYGAQRSFRAPAAGRGGFETAPELVAIGRDRFLLVWVEGNVESHQLRAQSVVAWGDGLVTYVTSVDGEFDVLATPIACAMN